MTHPIIERRANSICLTPEQIEQIAEKASDKAVEKITHMVYQEIGRNIIQKAIWIVGVIGASIFFWLNANGFIHTK